MFKNWKHYGNVFFNGNFYPQITAVISALFVGRYLNQHRNFGNTMKDSIYRASCQMHN